MVAILFVALLALPAGHDGERTRQRVVIDTDGAADDLRAICLLLSSPAVEVCAIVTSEGALVPGEAARKVRALLRSLDRKEIPVGTGRPTGIAPPPWRAHSRRVPWGEEDDAGNALGAVEVLEKMTGGVTFVALGALTNLHDLLERCPAARPREVVWYNGHAVLHDGANYAADSSAARRVLASGVPVEVVSGERHAFPVDDAFIAALSRVDASCARLVVSSHRSPALRSLVASGHTRSWDDLVALRLLAPELFTSRPLSPTVMLSALSGEDAARRAREIFLHVIDGK
ncbi:MAG: nucleoside hydrolase [Odoribacteraceae bacterium]|nr:nucleoside hydrolase [Odoribacteraceae bacterium]